MRLTFLAAHHGSLRQTPLMFVHKIHEALLHTDIALGEEIGPHLVQGVGQLASLGCAQLLAQLIRPTGANGEPLLGRRLGNLPLVAATRDDEFLVHPPHGFGIRIVIAASGIATMAGIHRHYQFATTANLLPDGLQQMGDLVVGEMLFTPVLLAVVHEGIVGNPTLVPLTMGTVPLQPLVAIKVGDELTMSAIVHIDMVATLTTLNQLAESIDHSSLRSLLIAQRHNVGVTHLLQHLPHEIDVVVAMDRRPTGIQLATQPEYQSSMRDGSHGKAHQDAGNYQHNMSKHKNQRLNDR